MSPPHILVFDQLDSTNAEARRRAEAGEAGPVWLMARRQTEGRGRRGRVWETGQGNLAATLLTATDLPPAEAAQVSFVTALAVSDLVSAHLPPEVVKVKWPNDVLVRGAKIAGILVESGRRDDGRLWLAIGVGVNLTSAPADPERPATAIGPAAPSPEDALAYLADRFTVWERIWRDYGFEAIAPAWTNHAYGLGEPCVARLSNEEIQGVAEGLEPDGALRLRLPNGELRRITAGDVFF